MSFDPKAFLKQIQDDPQVPRRDLTNNLRHIHIEGEKEEGGDGPFQPFKTSWMRKPTDKLKQLYVDRLGETEGSKKSEKAKDEDTGEAKPARRRRRGKKDEEKPAEEKPAEEKAEEPKPARRRRRGKKEETSEEKPAEKSADVEIPASSNLEEKVNHLGKMLDEQTEAITALATIVAKLDKKLDKKTNELKKIVLALGEGTDILKVLLVDTRLALASGEVEVFGGSDSGEPANFLKDDLFIQTAEDLGIKIEGNA